jgi:hypothetical protein
LGLEFSTRNLKDTPVSSRTSHDLTTFGKFHISCRLENRSEQLGSTAKRTAPATGDVLCGKLKAEPVGNFALT